MNSSGSKKVTSPDFNITKLFFFVTEVPEKNKLAFCSWNKLTASSLFEKNIVKFEKVSQVAY
jgi:hypothetical protein